MTRDPNSEIILGSQPGGRHVGGVDGLAPRRRALHPLVAAAAIAIIVACVVATASILGLLPRVGASASPDEDITVSHAPASEHAAASGVITPAPAGAPSSEGQATTDAVASPATRTASNKSVTPTPHAASTHNPLAQAPSAPAVCANCGVVQTTREVHVDTGRASGADPNNLIGTLGGAAAGGLVGHQFGGGHGKDALTILGALGGALAGREVQQSMRKPETRIRYELVVRMDDGATRTFHTDSLRFASGDHVRVVDNQLVAR